MEHDEISYYDGVTFEQAEKIAKEYAKKEGLVMGTYEGSGVKAPWVLGSNYSWAAWYPEYEGKIIGLPGHVVVDDSTGLPTYAMFMWYKES